MEVEIVHFVTVRHGNGTIERCRVPRDAFAPDT